MTARAVLPAEPVLVDLLKKREETGVRLLYDYYSSALYGVIFRIIPDQETAEDLLQDAFVKIWKNIDSYDASKGRLYTWLLNIARNTAIDATRSKAYRENGQIQSIDNNVYQVDKKHQHITGVDHIGLGKVLDQLKPEQRQLIDLLYFGGYTQSEVAEKLSIPLGTVKTRVKAAMTRLRQLLQGE